MPPKKIMLIAWGTRGDLQPVASLALGLKNLGREVCVFAPPPATDIIQASGVPCIEAQENVSDFVTEMFGNVDLADRSISGIIKLAKFSKQYLNSPEYVATQTEDMKRASAVAQEFQPDALVVPNIIYGPFMCIAEALQIPVITYDLQINHPTTEYPLFTMEVGRTPKFMNRLFYRIKSSIYPKTIKSKFAIMREICDLPADTYRDGSPFKIWPHDLPQMCAVSPGVCPQPQDWPEQKRMSGWWFLPDATDYTPSPELVEFLKCRPVYIGFGSMAGNEAFRTNLSTLAIKSLQLAESKGILLGGWAGLRRDALDTSNDEGLALYQWAEENVFEIDSCPHDWLFPQCSAVIHHGGAGTLAAGIRAGIPNIICASQGDQPFHGSIVKDKGIGDYLGIIGSPKLTPELIAAAIKQVTSDQNVLAAAKTLAEVVGRENGVQTAIDFIDCAASNYAYPWPIKQS